MLLRRLEQVLKNYGLVMIDLLEKVLTLCVTKYLLVILDV